jgi:16S rRNA (adenine1518-N6/adenine1519-N6)-dimethyltransferase
VAEGARLPRPRKRFGQHFLTDVHALERIVDALAPEPVDTVVEIGPGRGALTKRLSARCRRLIAIEIDRDLVRHLREDFTAEPNVEIMEGDALETDWAAVAGTPYLLAGNLPYYITTPLIFRVLATPRPTRAVLLVQKEVAARLAAIPGSSDYGALSVNVQVTSTIRAVGRVGAGSFNPRPKVDSSIVLITPLGEPLVSSGDEGPFRKFVQAAFGMRRKQLLRLVRELWVSDASKATDILTGLDLKSDVRPETLSPSDFVRLYRAIAADTAEHG